MVYLNIFFGFIALHELALFVTKYLFVFIGFIILCPITLILVIHLSNSNDEEEVETTKGKDVQEN